VNEPNSQTNKNRRRFRLQYSLRTMLILTLVAALLCAWLLRPKSEDRVLAGGALRIRAQVTYPEPDKSKKNPEPVGPILNGRWTLLDRHDRRLATGYYEDDSPVGRWTYYHANGREALSGNAAHRTRRGNWTARFDNGKVRSQTTETQIEHTLLADGLLRQSTCWSPIRNGPARQYWKTGRLRATGGYVKDLREGDWTFFDRDGRRVAQGPYRRGLRHGTWRCWDTAEGKPKIEEYVHGRRLPELEDLLPELTKWLLGDDVGQQVLAAHRLAMLGPPAVPALKKAIATGDVRRCLLAVRALKQIGPDAKSASPEVARLAEQSLARLKCSALVALAELDPDRAEASYDRLLQYATGETARLRDRAEMALACAGPAGLKALKAALMDKTPAVRYAALASIGRMLQRQLYSTVAVPAQGEAPTTDEIRAVLEAAQENPDEKIRDAAKQMKDMWRRTLRVPFVNTPMPVVG